MLFFYSKCFSRIDLNPLIHITIFQGFQTLKYCFMYIVIHITILLKYSYCYMYRNIVICITTIAAVMCFRTGPLAIIRFLPYFPCLVGKYLLNPFVPTVPTCVVRETASLGIMGEPRVPPLSSSETIVLSEHYRL